MSQSAGKPGAAEQFIGLLASYSAETVAEVLARLILALSSELPDALPPAARMLLANYGLTLGLAPQAIDGNSLATAIAKRDEDSPINPRLMAELGDFIAQVLGGKIDQSQVNEVVGRLASFSGGAPTTELPPPNSAGTGLRTSTKKRQ